MKRWLSLPNVAIFISIAAFAGFVLWGHYQLLKTYPPDCSKWERALGPFALEERGVLGSLLISSSLRGALYINPNDRSEVCEIAYVYNGEGYQDTILWQNMENNDTGEHSAWLIDASGLYYHKANNAVTSYAISPLSVSRNFKDFISQIQIDLIDTETDSFLYRISFSLSFQRVPMDYELDEDGEYKIPIDPNSI